jgi:glycosyltransferase involved in cell wall biosynthesis
MKLLVVAPYFFPKIGGTENYIYNIAKGLKEKYNWEIIVITSNHEKKKYKEEKIDGMKIYLLPRWFKISNTPINPLWYFQIKRIIKNERPDIINAHTPVPFISDVAARVCNNIPFILSYHNDLIKGNILLNLICKFYYFAFGNKTLKISDKIIATSEYYAKNSPYLTRYFNKISIVPPGVQITKFHLGVNKFTLQKKYGNYPFVLFVGQLDKTHIHKGIYYLIDAISLVKKKFENIVLLVVGKGDNIDNYKNYAQKSSLEKNVIFTGFVPIDKLPEYYAGSNVTILPTLNNSEGFGMVLIEAGACGKPVIGTSVGGIPFVIDDNKTGLLVPPKDPKALAEAVTKILNNSDLAKKMGENGYKKVKENFTWEKQIKKTNDLFRILYEKQS